MTEFMFIVLLSCFVLTVTGRSNVTGSDKPVHVTVGHDVILPCELKPPYYMTNRTVEWKHYDNIALLYRSMGEVQGKNFIGRAYLFLDKLFEGNISLKLTNVTERHEGKYSCFVPELDSQVSKVFIKLIVDPEENRNKGNQTDSDTKTEENNNNWHHSVIVTVIIVVIVATATVATVATVAIVPIAAIVAIVIFIWRRRVNNNRHAGQGGGRPRDEYELVPMAGNVQPDQHAGQDGGGPQEENELIPRDGNIQPDLRAGQDGVEPQEDHVVVPMDDGIEPQEENEEALSADNIQPDPHAGQDGGEPQEENEEVPMDGNVQPDPHAGQDGVEPQEEHEQAAVVGNIQPGRRGKYKPALRTGNIQKYSHVRQRQARILNY